MRTAVATSLQVDRVLYPPASNRRARVVARLMRTFLDLKLLPAKHQHLGHEWHAVFRRQNKTPQKSRFCCEPGPITPDF